MVAIIFLAGCIAAPAQNDPADTPPTLDAGARAACEARGGRVGIAGLLGGEFCIERAPDAGQPCSRASDCAAWCEAETRTCAEWLDPFGCRSYLNEAGEVESICVD